MSPRLPPDPAEVSMRSERSAFAEAIPPGDVTAPCRGPVCIHAYYDDPWKTPVVMAPLRIADQDGVLTDGELHTQSLTSFGMQDGDDGVPGVYRELGRQTYSDARRGMATAELVQDPGAAAEIKRLEAEIIEALRGFAAKMETALEPWLLEWKRSGWLGAAKALFAGAVDGVVAWWEGEGDFWASIGEWISNIPDLASDVWNGMADGAKALWENKGKILRILQDMAEGATAAVKTGLEALLALVEQFPDTDEIVQTLRQLVRNSAHWMNAMHELAQTQVLNVLGSTMLAVLVATTPNFWTEMVGKVGGFLIPEILLGILFGILAVLTGGTAGAGLMMRLLAFTRKVHQALKRAGAAGRVAAQIFAFMETLSGKLIDLIKALLRNRTGKGSGAVGDEIPIVRKVSKRRQYLGATPGKNSRTGNEVRKRMREEGTLRTNRRGQDEFLAEDGNWYLVDTPTTHMGHYPEDAVDWWNREGYKHGARSQEVKDWMLDSNNYRFEHGPFNSSRGGATKSRYRDPL